MPGNKLIADGGATKAEWCLLTGSKKKTIFTQGLSPYFLTADQIREVLEKELCPNLKNASVDEIYFYGTGCASPANAKIIKTALQKNFPGARIEVTHDLMAAARAVCGKGKGIVANLGTGSFCCYYNGKKIVNQIPGIGYVLGDEGSGAYLGRKVIQYFLYDIMDEELRAKFDAKYTTTRIEILENVYKKPLPNRYMAGFAIFLAENRGHFMVENILEDGLNDFFYLHLNKYKETSMPAVSFVGGVAYVFKDVVKELCKQWGFKLGKIIKNPMEGLVDYHS